MHVAIDLDAGNTLTAVTDKGKRPYRRGVFSQLGQKEYNRRHAVQRRASLRRFLDSYLLTVGCVDCGFDTNKLALEFDHVVAPGPCRSPSRASSIKAALAELDRCEVRCANCHAIRHARRKVEGWK